MTLRDQIEGTDLDVFMDSEAGFARDVVLNGTQTIKAIFDEHVPVVNDYTGEAESELSTLVAKTSDLVGVKPHDTVTVGLVTYEVMEIRPDGTGLTTLTLNRAG